MNNLICEYCFYQHFNIKKTKFGYELQCLQCGEKQYIYTKKRYKELDKLIKENGGII